MSLVPVGLDDLALYLPENSISMDLLLKQRIQEDQQWERRLSRALSTTGQVAMRFPSVWEDTVTLAAQACETLLETNSGLALERLRFLTLGTETAVDMSKSGSSYVQGLLEKKGYPLPRTLSTFQVQHACAGGALSLLTVAGFLQSAGRTGETGLILTSDIARYEAPSTAEVTQGAGAVALLAARNPRLLEIDLDTTGFFSSDVDDFFRPLGSVTAKVKGGYSVQCYNEGLIGAFEDHCARAGVDPARELESIDLFCLHVPYSRMPLVSMEKLLAKHLNLDGNGARAFLEERGFFAGLEPAKTVGNIYTGSLFLGLAYALRERLGIWGSHFQGKKVLLSSYGSGNTMAVFTGKLAPGAREVIGGWDLNTLMEGKREASFLEYLDWISLVKTPKNYASLLAQHPPKPGRFHLAALREDGYREYGF